MRSGTPFEAGELVLIPFPFSDLSGLKQRPVLVLSDSAYNRRSRDFIVCGVTSNLKYRGHSVELDSSGLLSGTMPVKSLIKVDKLFTLEQSLARKRFSRIKPEILALVRTELRGVLGL